MTTLSEAATTFLDDAGLPTTQATLDATVAWMSCLSAADIGALGDTIDKAAFIKHNYQSSPGNPGLTSANIAHAISEDQPVGNGPSLALANVDALRGQQVPDPEPEPEPEPEAPASDAQLAAAVAAMTPEQKATLLASQPGALVQHQG